MSPMVSVLMPAYNVEQYVLDAVKCILSQTLTDFELIISDDCSTDNTYSILREVASSDVRIRLYRQSENLGLVKNKNFLLKKAHCEFLIFHDSDDLCDPKLLEVTLDNLISQNEKLSVASFRRLICKKGEWIKEDLMQAHQNISSPNNLLIIDRPLERYPFMFANIMFHRDVLNEIGPFDEYFNYSLGEDFYWLIKANCKFKIVFDLKPLYYYRNHSSSTTNLLNSPQKLIISRMLTFLYKQRIETGSDFLEMKRFDILKEMEKDFYSDKKAIASQYQIWAAKAVDKEDHLVAVRLIKMSIFLNPFDLQIWRTIIYLFRSYLLIV